MDLENMPLFYFEEQISALTSNELKMLCMELKKYSFEKYNIWVRLLSYKQLDNFSILFAIEILQRKIDHSNRSELLRIAVDLFIDFKTQEIFFIDKISNKKDS